MQTIVQLKLLGAALLGVVVERSGKDTDENL